MAVKGIVLEKLKNKYIVLTPDGTFKTVYSVQHAEVGEEISWEEKKSSRICSWKINLAIAVAASILFVFTFNFFNPFGLSKAVAYIAYDLNPSIEMSVNRKGIVLTAEGLNQEGKAVIDSVSLLNKHIDKAISSITEKAYDFGYFTANNNIILISMTQLEDEKLLNSNFAEEITQTVQKVAATKMVEVTIETIEIEERDRVDAKAQGLSPGSFIISQTAQDTGFPISKEELKQKGVMKTLKDKGVNIKEIIEETKEKAKEKEKEKNKEDKNKSDKAKTNSKGNSEKSNNRANNNEKNNGNNKNNSNKNNSNNNGSNRNN